MPKYINSEKNHSLTVPKTTWNTILAILEYQFFSRPLLFSRVRTISKSECQFQTRHWRLVTACSAVLLLNTDVFVCVDPCFATNSDYCAFEGDSFGDKLRGNCLDWGNLTQRLSVFLSLSINHASL